MAEKIFYCAACRVKFRARDFDPNKVYKCKRCGTGLKPFDRASAVSENALTQSNVTIEDDPLIGQTIAGCRILSKLGEGGMGAVYKAEEVTLKRLVAVKILPKQLVSRDQEYVERFIREAQSAAQLDHPNTVTVYAAGEEEGSYYIQMQFVDGCSLGC